MAGPISAAWSLNNTTPKKRGSSGKPLATVSNLTGAGFEPKASCDDGDEFYRCGNWPVKVTKYCTAQKFETGAILCFAFSYRS